MIMNLKLRGKLDGLQALIVGGMLNMKPSPSGFRKPAHDIIREAVAGQGLRLPVKARKECRHLGHHRAVITHAEGA